MPDAPPPSNGWLPPRPPGPAAPDPAAEERRWLSPRGDERSYATAPAEAPSAGTGMRTWAGSARPASEGGAEDASPTFVHGSAAPSRSSRLATASLVLGVIGLVLVTLSLGLAAIVSLPFSAAAWAAAAVERRRARDAAPGRPQPATAGLILGVLGVALGIVAVIVWSLLLAGGTPPEDLLEQWRQELERQRQATGVEV